ncbi:MAG: FAD-binding protein [Oscillospiraceae bacterium]|nr:FAD-binding protein [Oscillospiraceae bacterium]
MNTLSRRDFLKGSVAGAAALTLTSLGLGAAKAEGIYAPGTYSATAQGIGIVTVTMTFDADSITDVVIDASAETPSIGQAAAGALEEALLNAQSAEIDGVSGATLTSSAVRKAAAKCIAQAKGEVPVEQAPIKVESDNKTAWLGNAPEIPEGAIAETWDTDLLIVGAGNGGLAAAAYAASEKLSFRLIEKMGSVGRVRGWYGAVDSEDIVASGEAPMDRGALRRELQKYSSGKANMKLFNTWINESADMHHFIKGLYAQYLPEAQLTVTVGDEAHWPEPEKSGYFFPAIEHTWGAKMGRNDLFKTHIEACGYSIDFNTSLVKLETEDGRVIGAIAQNTETEAFIRIRAAKGVLLATGGYPGNPEMMEALDPMAVSVITTNVCNPQDTGDGIKAALWAGAALQKESAPMIFDRGVVAPGVDSGYKVLANGNKVFPGENGQFGVGSQPFLKVNRRGERFANESGTYDNILYAAASQPGGVYAQIFDSNMYEDAVRFHTIGCSAGLRNRGPEGYKKQFDSFAEKGEGFVADTLEELAEMLGFDAEAKETFLQTCTHYNELYDQQDDPDFGKPAYRLSALREPPFYGYWLGGCLLTTEQGIMINENAQAVDTDTNVIEGLFVAGDCSGGFFYNNYPCLMPGIAMGRTMTFAIKAVKVAFGLE